MTTWVRCKARPASIRAELSASIGAFSDKLQRFQLPSAHHYVLPLVACAVARGADSFAYFCM